MFFYIIATILVLIVLLGEYGYYSEEIEKYEKQDDFREALKTKKRRKNTIIGTVIAALMLFLFVFSITNCNSNRNNTDTDSSSQTKHQKSTFSYNYYSDSSSTSSTSSHKWYKRVKSKALVDDINDYDHEFIKTTVKVTSISADGSKVAYTVYDYDGYDKVKITLTNINSGSKLKTGDYITVCGKARDNSSYSDDLLISIRVAKIVKTDKTLFKKIGSYNMPHRYSDGNYKVGTDIPAGSYIAYPSSYISGYLCVTSDSSGSFDSIVFNDNFDGQKYFDIADGQYLELNRCVVRPVSEKEPVEKSGYITDGQYLVGDDIPAGEYNLIAADSDTSAYCCVQSAPNDEGVDNIIFNDNFTGNKYITVYEGQYLELSRCKLKLN